MSITELKTEDLVSVTAAAAILDRADVSPRVEAVPLARAIGRRLAEQVVADRDYPPFDKSLMDGYAMRIGEAAGEFEIVGEVLAGSTWNGPPLRGRQVVSIMTGAPLPGAAEGHIGIVPVEQSQRIGERAVRLSEAAQSGRHIARRGSDRPAQSVLLRPGTLLGAQHLGALASVGKASVLIYAPPRCAVLATGDELVPLEEQPKPHQIRNANSPTLLALLDRLGGDVVDAGHVRDDLVATRKALGEWLDSSCDCLFITGGMSMGDRDYVPRVLRELGVELHITKLKIKPGKPFVFGTSKRQRGFVAGSGGEAGAQRGTHTTYVFGLPGNPVSAYACTLVLAARLLTRLAGAPVAAVEERFIELPLAEPLEANGPRQFYQPARIERTASGERARPLKWRGSADVFTLAEADALIERSAGAAACEAGAMVRSLKLP